jgi:hypothetical protein
MHFEQYFNILVMVNFFDDSLDSRVFFDYPVGRFIPSIGFSGNLGFVNFIAPTIVGSDVYLAPGVDLTERVGFTYNTLGVKESPTQIEVEGLYFRHLMVRFAVSSSKNRNMDSSATTCLMKIRFTSPPESSKMLRSAIRISNITIDDY